MAIGCAISMVVQRNPLYSAISLIGVFISLACLYVMLAAPFIAAVQVIVYAGAIMVLVVFVIMLLNVEEAERQASSARPRPDWHDAGGDLFRRDSFHHLLRASLARRRRRATVSDIGQTARSAAACSRRICCHLRSLRFLLLMAIVGAMTLARTGGLLSPRAVVVPGHQILAKDVLDPRAGDDPDANSSRARRMKSKGFGHRRSAPRRRERRLDSNHDGTTAFMVSGAFGRAVHDRRGRRHAQAQRHLDVHVHRADAECREPDVCRVLEFLPRCFGSVVCLYRHDGGGRGSRRGLGIIIAIFRTRESLDVDDSSSLRL